MEWLIRVLELIQLLGWASLFGGALVQLRLAEPEINRPMFGGVLVQFVAGVAVAVISLLGPGPVNLAKIIVVGVIMLATVVLVVLNRRFATIPRGLLALIMAVTVITAALEVLWV
ncbi:hypothetical protein [Naumannella cuiyingiana]|uniref:Integral membrane protein n=1 Tax=Naumannella cuiyingiana TaxID=1347891 RepID=A0A7Z0D7H2_9ACTN|nr:hypothetical protein [Naumannella cuiyingiana]NYI70313.1 hypothetical protein [Naumannella cuiyingiana]